jgi:putative molybdopterin biosynthesis protein
MSMKQEQFLEVIGRDEAERRFFSVLDLSPLQCEEVLLEAALGRVLAEDVAAVIDVPGFDRSNVDGFAVNSTDTFGATEEEPRQLQLSSAVLTPGKIPAQAVSPGTATSIATGAAVPRGADSVVMVEFTDAVDTTLLVRRPVIPGSNITFAGTDIGRGETVLRRGDLLTSRETGVLAALGQNVVRVIRHPRVAIISTGDELVAPGGSIEAGQIYDSNATVLTGAVRESGGEPVGLGIVPDDAAALEAMLRKALACDLVLLSGGTSKGAGDISYRVVERLGLPGIVAHGVALKPGKPLCLAALRQPGRDDASLRTVPVVILPGFPTSAIFTFHDFVAPVIRCMAGHRQARNEFIKAKLPFRLNSERGRTEYALVNLVASADSSVDHPLHDLTARPPGNSPLTTQDSPTFIAYPIEKGSGSVTTFAYADGYLTIPRQREYLEAGEEVDVRLLAHEVRPADLVVIGSHCIGLDYLLGRVRKAGISSKFLAVGSLGGLAAAKRGECDIAGTHLLHPETKEYNTPFLSDDLVLVRGYGRLQGIIYRRKDARFEGLKPSEAVAGALADPDCILINRNRGSGTRVLIDGLLGKAQPRGYLTEAKSHNAVAAAVAQARADWGVAIQNVADQANLGFIPLTSEQYDFVIPRARLNRPAVQAFCALVGERETIKHLAAMGFDLH